MIYTWVPFDDIIYSDNANTDKPRHNDWSKHESNFVCSTMLEGEQSNQDDA